MTLTTALLILALVEFIAIILMARYLVTHFVCANARTCPYFRNYDQGPTNTVIEHREEAI